MRQEKSTKLQPQEISTKQTYIYIYIKKKKIHLPQHSNSYQATENEANPPHPGTIQNL
jgi:hypothetical protein